MSADNDGTPFPKTPWTALTTAAMSKYANAVMDGPDGGDTIVLAASLLAACEHIAESEARLAKEVDHLRLHCAVGLGVSIDNVGGLEGAIVAVAVEALKRREEVRKLKAQIAELEETK